MDEKLSSKHGRFDFIVRVYLPLRKPIPMLASAKMGKFRAGRRKAEEGMVDLDDVASGNNATSGGGRGGK
jgi:hypothetical protein